MGIAEDLADALARDVIAAMDELGDDTLVDQVSKILIATSSTTQEAFMTSVKVRISERRARRFLDDRLAAARVRKA
ncbi:hypothetical protein RNZ50_11920 [Paracoccaceae bacterium Fryx2]|nr:hypothetical protein [Paracoccaceae bacterium Fryx2]